MVLTPGKAGGEHGGDRAQTPIPEDESERAPDRRKDEGFAEQNLEEAQPSGAERRADADVALPRGRPAQDQVGDVGAGDEQHESYGAEQDQERTSDLSQQFLPQRHGADRDLQREVGRVVVANPCRERREVGGGLCGRRPLAKPSDDAEVVIRAARLPLRRREDERHPDVGRRGVRRCAPPGKLETGGHHANHRERLAIDGDRRSDRRAPGEVARRQAVAEDGDAQLVLVLVGEERAALGGFHTEYVEERRGDRCSVDLFRLSAARQFDSGRAIRAEVRERLLVLQQIDIVGRGHAEAVAAGSRDRLRRRA